MNDNNNTLYISNNKILSLGTDDHQDIDYILKLIIKSRNNLKLELKYPNFQRLELENKFLVENNYLKNVHIKIKPCIEEKKAAKSKTTNSLCQTMLGLYTNLGYDLKNKDFKFIIQGYSSSKSFSYRQYLKIGDLILSINDILINSTNIESVMSQIKQEQTIKLTVLSPLTHVNLNTNDEILRKYEREFSFKLKKDKTTKKIVANSKIVNNVKTDSSNQTHSSPKGIEDIFMHVMIISLNKLALKKQQSTKEKEDLIYKYPNNESQINTKKFNLIGTSQIIETIRGLYMTLAFVVKDLKKSDEAVW
jgi:hypothetical protein